MRRPDQRKTPPGRVALGEAVVERGIDGSNGATIGANDPPCQCHIRGAICLVCRRWDKRIRGHEQRTEFMQRHAVGKRAAGG